MRIYILRRFLQMIPLLFGISALTFLLLQMAPGDFLNQMGENPAISPATIDAMRRNFGLDRPWYVQYGLYLKNILLHFDFGESFSRHQPVFTVIREGLGNTLILASAAGSAIGGLLDPICVAVRAIGLGVIPAVQYLSGRGLGAVAESGRQGAPVSASSARRWRCSSSRMNLGWVANARAISTRRRRRRATPGALTSSRPCGRSMPC